MMCGGTTGMQSPDDEANQVLASVKDQLHEKAGTSGEGEISDQCDQSKTAFSETSWLQNSSGRGNKLFHEDFRW